MDAVIERTVSIHWEIAAKLNFACQQSSYPILRDLRIENLNQDERLEGVLVTLSADPDFLKPKSWRVDRIAPGGIVPIKDRALDLQGSFLLGLTEAVRGSVTLTVEYNGAILAEAVKPVEVLAYNEWGGAGYMPELLAAFCTPNDPAVDRILHSAAMLLRKGGKPDALDGYRSGSRKRVWETASAIYTAIANLGIAYAVPPTSFERDGQKIRLPSQILEGGVATCLDTTMLFAAAMEKAGLNPIIAMPEGHALVGVWLQPEELSTIVVEDAETLRKRYELKELILIETTLVTSHVAPPLTRAIEQAIDMLSPDKDATFSAAVDIRRARAHQIKPLALKSGGGGKDAIGEESSVEIAMEEAPALPDFDTEVEEKLPETPDGRLERWQRKLLDLSARNPLLNHRSTKTSLLILCPDPGKLEDRLADGAKISIQAVPQPTSQRQDEEVHRHRTGQVISREYALDALGRNQVLVDLPEEELSKRAVAIYRNAETSLQEGGANTLYLALGFLSWKRDQADERRFRAPLILLPVTLQRQSVRSGIKMLAHDDETRFNTTLLEMLRKDFEIDIKGLDGQLPEDQSGVDVRGVWDSVRRAVKDAPGFEVVEDVVLGHFSFAKYLMWKDLVDRTDDLRRNAIVKHLIDTPRDAYESSVEFVAADRLDRDFSPSDLLAPLPADSSQMAAIATADRGKDFIIIGPPGTGKSQTISNMIAHLLGKGKTVLFVSEKTAALNVVHRRLANIGLGRFCLELHSNKAKKTKVLAQLAAAWAAGHEKTADTWAEEAENLKKIRDRLNRVVDYMHTKRRNGLTPHYAIGVHVRDREFAERIAFSWPRADQHDADRLKKMREAADMLRVQAKAVDDIRDSPFQLVASADWSPQWEAELIERAAALAEAAEGTDKAATALTEAIKIVLPDRSMSRLLAIAELAEVLVASYRKQSAFALEPDGIDRIEALEEAVTRLKDYAAAQANLSVPYDPMAWRSLDGEEIGRLWAEAEAIWWPKRFFAKRTVIKKMRLGGAKGTPNPTSDATVLSRLRQEGEAIDRLDKLLSGFRDWSAHTTDPGAAQALHDLGNRARTAVGRLVDDTDQLVQIRSKIRMLLQDGNDMLAPDAPIGRAAADYQNAVVVFWGAAEAFHERAGRELREAFADKERALPALKEKLEELIARKAGLNQWCTWRKRRTDAIDLELGQLVKSIEQGRTPADEIPETFEAAYCAWWASRLFEEDEILKGWSTAEHTDAIEKFRAVDETFLKITAQYIAAKLSGQIPGQTQIGRNQQWGLIKRLTAQKRPRIPIRKMIEDAPEPISKLAPCLMMSPLSVAQYLPSEQAPFDVVIFDEASQLTVWDAVGAIARGSQTIIAGDPMQMPPTSFFSRADDDGDGNVDYDGDMESILDELRSASIPEQTLNLHYRSRRESLIAFSNYHYYDNRLVTFPAPIHPDCGVRLVQCNGYYARGKSRHNEGEARAIVAEIVRRLTSGDTSEREATIGVVTFNAEQQSLILDLLDKARGANSEIEWAFAEDAIEPVFVKNLETVQGDERDIILFSVTYGPDQAGHVTMNFGPLNRDGGERRLNVAMTRARLEMVVFSTLHPDKIDLSRSNAVAVRHLKHFLEYAERGPSALGTGVQGSMGDFESPFETAVARELREKGWIVRPQIGVSAFRIDLGIVHPDEPGVFLAGVECDGAMYHSSAYARERDKIRQAVLEGLGWTLFRVWSTDWWINQQGALATLDAHLRSHLEEDRVRRRGEAEKNDKQDASYDEPPEAGTDDAATKIGPSAPIAGGPRSEEERDYEGHPTEDSLGETNRQPHDASEKSQSAFSFRGSGSAPEDLHYQVASFDKGAFAPDADRFYDDAYDQRLIAMIDHVIDVEGPIHEDVLVRRIARHHGFKRAGRLIRERVLNLARKRRGSTKEEVGCFFWRKGTVKDRLAPARLIDRDEETRKIERIAVEELSAIATSLGEDDPSEIARALNIGHLSAIARARLEKALLGGRS